MLLKKFIGRSIDAKVADDTLTLDICGIAIEFNDRML